MEPRNKRERCSGVEGGSPPLSGNSGQVWGRQSAPHHAMVREKVQRLMSLSRATLPGNTKSLDDAIVLPNHNSDRAELHTIRKAWTRMRSR